MRGDVPCWSVCDDIETLKPVDPHESCVFEQFVARAAEAFLARNADETYWYEADLDDTRMPEYRMVRIDEHGDPVPGEESPPNVFVMKSSTVGDLRKFQRAVNAVKSASRIPSLLTSRQAELDMIAYRSINSFKMDDGSTIVDFLGHTVTYLGSASQRLVDSLLQLQAGLADIIANAADAAAKLDTQPPPFPDRFYRTLGNQIVQAEVFMMIATKLTTGNNPGSTEPFRALGCLTQLSIGMANLKALAETP